MHRQRRAKSCIKKCVYSVVVVVAVFVGIVWIVVPIILGTLTHDYHSLWRAGEEIAEMARSLSRGAPDGHIATDFAEELRVLREKQPERRKKWYSLDFWVVVENISQTPPRNLIIVSTRNIDAASLRTKYSIADRAKRLRFEWNDNFKILRKRAFLFRADGQILRISKIYPETTVCEFVYGAEPFDCATNNASGLPVGYRMPDGTVVIPTNE
jgi:hypothetical protein